MTIFCVSLVIILIAVATGFVVLWRRYSELIKKLGTFSEVVQKLERHEARLNTAAAELLELDMAIKAKIAERRELDTAISIAIVEQSAAETLAKKNLELESERLKSEFDAQLKAEFLEMNKNSPKTLLEQELKEINSQIETARQTLLVQQEQLRNAAEQEDFIDFHSITLTPQDLRDIELIRDFAPQLSRQEAFFKLIWTEFYQKPIQVLCKTLSAEKIRGIYKITNIQTQRMYIGQAVDIAARWKEHCKAGLGIGSTSYMTNKFYKALHEEGIENFTFEILEMGDINLNEREVYWINYYNATTFGYNSKIGG